MITISIICVVSILLNCFLIWYIKGILTKLLFVSENQQELSNALASFSNHLNTIYELETFYGDETLGSLIEHMKSVTETIEEYESIYTLIEEEEEEEELYAAEEEES
tara:strand:- start:1051 stop:1371 length:321 start_codon:yes stop_codon:yes gene_type:complete